MTNRTYGDLQREQQEKYMEIRQQYAEYFSIQVRQMENGGWFKTKTEAVAAIPITPVYDPALKEKISDISAIFGQFTARKWHEELSELYING